MKKFGRYIYGREKGAPLGVATLDVTGRIPATQLPTSAMEYKGVWNANTNTPALGSGAGVNGDYYLTSVAGTTNLDGENDWDVGDALVFNGSLGVWQKAGKSEFALSNGNGTTYSGTSVGLGGDLTQSTTYINGGGTKSIQFGGANSSAGENLNTFSLLSQSFFIEALTTYNGSGVGGNVIFNPGGFIVTNFTQGFSQFTSNGSQQELSLSNTTSGLSSTILNRTDKIELEHLLNGNGGNLTISPTSTVFTDSTSALAGIEYAADYSSTFSLRSLVDKAYVDNAVAGGGGLGAGSGLTANLGNIDLGGNLSSNVVINAGNTHSMQLGGFGGQELTTMFVSASSLIALSCGNSFNISPSGANYFDFSPNKHGIVYGADYSATFTARSLVDKGYVDTFLQNGSGTFIVGGNKVFLGGDLLNDAVFGGTDTYRVAFGVPGSRVTDYSARANTLLFNEFDDGTRSTQMSFTAAGSFITSSDNHNLTLGTSSTRFIISNASGTFFFDGNTVKEGIQYAADYSSSFTNESLVTKRYVDNAVTGGQTLNKTFTLEEPTASDNITVFRTDVAITVQEVIACSTGSSPSTTYQLKHHTDRSNAGNALTTSAATTSTTTGDTASLSDVTIPANSWVWLETSAASGTDVYLSVDIRYTED